MPRVSGLGAKFVQDRIADKGAPSGLPRSRRSGTSRTPSHELSLSNAFQGGWVRSSVHSSRPMRTDGDLIPFSMTESEHEQTCETKHFPCFNCMKLIVSSGISKINYDIIMGSANSYTNFKYSLNPRNFLYALNGELDITLTIPNNKKYLHIEKDYINNEFYSKIDIHNVTDNFLKDYSKIKFMKIILNKGDLLYIPSYWFYSIKFSSYDSMLLSFKYDTYMSTVSVLPEIIQSYLQNNNIKNNFLKIYNIV